ncbi:MAG: epimerase [Burkholderiales bacterium]|jgi:dolichol-phosphate mannosyltransferase|nr:epimerase [Burkholderiales bacterium]
MDSITPRDQLLQRNSISAIVACYKDAQAIPIMAERLVKVFEKCGIDYEIIFVDNGSPDESEEVIRNLSALNPKVIGITNSRSFEQTSQGSFRSGMEIATKDACVLLDGDLQDPPELIEDFISKWREGYDVVYGVRFKREAPLSMQWGSKAFYRIFDWLSTTSMPHDAGDFSLIDKKVVYWILKCNERDIFIRGIRAYVGFKQTGIEYHRPERMFGISSNNFFKNISWAKKGIFSFSRKPLDMLTTFGFASVIFTVFLAVFEIILHFISPQLAPKGITTIILLIMFFGSFNILAISVVGEYIAKIFEEVKQRPSFIRNNLIKNGKIISFPTNQCH